MTGTPGFERGQIRATARARLGDRPFLRIFARQVLTEWRFRLGRRISFRSRENVRARLAYSKMRVQEFEGINARQEWANWRTIPRNLSGLLPNRPLFALDICCGTGQSTEVLAWYLPPGSSLLGLEYNPRFVEKARLKTYPGQEGGPMAVSFRAQSVLETFRDPTGKPLSPESADLINSSGAVGFHFDAPALETLARECWRVLKAGGLAAIDSGLPGRRRRQIRQAFMKQGFRPVRASRSCIFDPYVQTVFVKA